MTKEIIIDETDVSNCSYYNKENYPYCCEVWDNECEAQNCYFKQLKRLEKENEELKKKREKAVELAEKYSIHYDEIYKNAEQISKKYYCYRHTLQEIKKYIAKICKEECGYVQKKRCPDCDCRFGTILDLITKAEEK